jgi:hypothetical protein
MAGRPAMMDDQHHHAQHPGPRKTEPEELLQAFADEHGLAALLDHMGLDGYGNRVVIYEKLRRAVVGEETLEGDARTRASLDKFEAHIQLDQLDP